VDKLHLKVLITGGAGYIGSVLTSDLLRAGCEVWVLDNLMYNQTPFMDVCMDERFHFVRGDCRDEALLARLIPEVDVIVPLACLTGAPLCDRDPWAAEAIVIDALKLILKLRKPEQRIIYPNTNSGYGISEQGQACSEESPLRPVSLYGRLKVQAEQMVLNAGNAVTFRLATVFGASQRMRLDLLVNDFVYRALNDRAVVLYQARAMRNYIHIRDVSRAMRHALANWDFMSNAVYNLGLSDANLSKLELCQKIQAHMPEFYFTEAEIGEDPDKRDYLVSNARIEGTGFKPAYSLDDGIRELLQVYQILRPQRETFSNFT
jgi:nucleoside-diphosphate-sugar epimerase